MQNTVDDDVKHHKWGNESWLTILDAGKKVHYIQTLKKCLALKHGNYTVIHADMSAEVKKRT